MASLPFSKTGMILGARGARACDMCGKEKARWYCAADEAYLCEKCDGCVHSANAVARRHERVKLGPNGAPVKLDRKRKDQAQQQEPCIKKLDAVPCHKWFRAPQRRRTKTRKPSIPKPFLNPTVNVEPKSVLGATDPPLFLKEEEEDEEGILLHPATPAAIHGDLPIKCEPASPTVHHDYSSSYDCPPSLTALQWTPEEADDFSLEVPTYEPFLRELIAASHGDLIKEILPTSSSSVCNDRGTTISAENASSDKDGLQPGLICNKLESTSTPLTCDDIEPSCVIEDGSISIDDDEVCHSDMEAFDVMDLCTSSAPHVNMMDDDELRADFPDLEMQACSSIFGGNPFKGKGCRELEMGSCVKLENLGDVDEDEKAMQIGNHDFYHQHSEVQQQYQHNQYYLIPTPAPVIGHPCNMFQKSLCLQLDYEDVLNAWSDRGSLWMDGQRPQTVPDVCFSDPVQVGSTGGGILVPVIHDNASGNSMNDQNSSSSSNANNGSNSNNNCVNDAEREARVMRYREKRRTRLFSKKIRYEVRKLNAERRPRMKGRFVKRSTFNDDV